MAYESYTEKFLTYLVDGNTLAGKNLTSDVESEIKSLRCTLTQGQEEIIKNVGVIISQLGRRQDKSAQTIAASTVTRFAEHLLAQVFQENFSLSKHDVYNRPSDAYRNVPTDADRGNSVQPAQYRESRDERSLQSNAYGPRERELPEHLTDRDRRQQTLPKEDIDIMKASIRSKHASESMRRNNPDIADLSDTNRPTKVAERFSELYDNEWTEAFETLARKGIGERDIAKLLLDIVQGAYTFCKEEAERQIQKINSAFIDILEFGQPYDTSRGLPADISCIIKHRKDMAAIAVKRLIKEFFQTKLPSICGTSLRGSSSENDVIGKYGNKAVELSWWMCVQDPPVYMCSTDTDFDENLYRAYTKSGREPDFFVWPALKLYREGGVLLKGVVQYK